MRPAVPDEPSKEAPRRRKNARAPARGRNALATREAVHPDKETPTIADQVRSLRATLHLTRGEPQEARALVDKLELGKAQDAKTRAMFATVAAEAWARTGQAKKAMETLE